MKYVRHSLALFLTLALVGVFGLAFAQTLTTAGTNIRNTATATFTDALGTPRSATSNEVITTVATVYSLDVDPSTVGPTGTTASTAADSTTIDFATTPIQSIAAAEGSTIDFSYTVTNGTNAGSTIALQVVEGVNGTDDQFDYSSITIIETDINGNVLASQPTDFTNLTFGQEETRYFIVQVVVPTGLNPGDTGKLDLVATNPGAVTAGQDAPNVSFDNSNTAQVIIAVYQLGLAKDATVSAPDANGFYSVTLDFYIDATKAAADPDIDITNLELTDDLNATFGTVPYTITSAPSIVSGDNGRIFVNPNFDGGTDTNLLVPDANNPSAPDNSTINTADPIVQIQVVVLVQGPVNTTNTANINGLDNNGNLVINDSTDGTNPDPTQSFPTPILAENPVISVSKAATITNTTGGTAPFTVEFNIYIENQGDVLLSGLSATEDLVAVFGSGNFTLLSGPTVTTSPTSGGVSANTVFDGGTDTQLIAAGSNLAAGELVVITLTVEVATAGDYFNSVIASGTSPGGATPTDTSNPGTTPSDPPGADDTATPVLLSGLTVVKSASTTSDGTGATVEPGDTITYTIVVTNTGTSDLTNVVVNDVIPTPTVYVTSSASATSATTTIAENGTPVTSIDWTIPTLAGNAFETLTFQVTVP